jgi:hypothetical protein
MNDDGSERSSYLPWLMAALILVIGGAKLDATRPLLARVVAIAVPVVPVAMGVYRLQGADSRVERGAAVVGGVAVVAGEICVANGFFGVQALSPAVEVARYALYAAALGALVVQVAAVRRGVTERFAAFLGISAVFALAVSAQGPGKDVFGSVFGAFFVALLFGGGAGLIVGELLSRAFKNV